MRKTERSAPGPMGSAPWVLPSKCRSEGCFDCPLGSTKGKHSNSAAAVDDERQSQIHEIRASLPEAEPEVPEQVYAAAPDLSHVRTRPELSLSSDVLQVYGAAPDLSKIETKHK